MDEDKASALLDDTNASVDVWNRLPNTKGYYQKALEKPLVFLVRSGGRDPKDNYMKQRTGKAWALNPSGFRPLKSRVDLKYARLSCKQAVADGYSLTGLALHQWSSLLIYYGCHR